VFQKKILLYEWDLDLDKHINIQSLGIWNGEFIMDAKANHLYFIFWNDYDV
jgi:hypothetical protein